MRTLVLSSLLVPLCVVGAQGAPPRHRAPVVPLTEVQFTQRIDSTIRAAERIGWFSGTVQVTRDGRIVFAKAYGLADRERKSPNTLDTRFDVGSMNKMMTAVAIAQLAEAGRVSLGATVGRYLPTYPNAAVRDSVTIAHLLSHTSGLGSYWNDRFERGRLRIRTVDDYLALFASDPLLFTPGERFEYSNSGFIVLGAIVEKVSGMRYDDYVAKRIFAPAGMTHTDFSAIADSTPSRAIGYMFSNGDGAPPQGLDFGKPAPPSEPHWNTLPNRGGPAGGGYSTVGDWTRFADALRSAKLVGKQWLDSLWTKRTGSPRPGSRDRDGGYGYGFSLRVGDEGRVVGHTGGAPGVAGALAMYVDRGWTVAVLANLDPPALLNIYEKITAGVAGVIAAGQR